MAEEESPRKWSMAWIIGGLTILAFGGQFVFVMIRIGEERARGQAELEAIRVEIRAVRSRFDELIAMGSDKVASIQRDTDLKVNDLERRIETRFSEAVAAGDIVHSRIIGINVSELTSDRDRQAARAQMLEGKLLELTAGK